MGRSGIVALWLAPVCVAVAAASFAGTFAVYPSETGQFRVRGENDVEFRSPDPRLGDGADGVALVSVWGFDLSFLPPESEITSAALHLVVGTVYGDPDALGPLKAGRVEGIAGAPSVDPAADWVTNDVEGESVMTGGPIVKDTELTGDLTLQVVGRYPSPPQDPDPGRLVVRTWLDRMANENGAGDYFYIASIWLELEATVPDPIEARPVRRHFKRCIPVAASLDGANGTRWETELEVTAADHPATVWLYFTEAGDDGAERFEVRRIDLEKRQSMVWDDVLPELFGRSETKGWIELFTTAPGVFAAARVANVGGDGVYGQAFSMVLDPWLLRRDRVRTWDSEERTLQLASVAGGNRTNVGVINLGPEEVTVTLSGWSSSGSGLLGEATVTLPPFGYTQIDRIETLIPELEGRDRVVLTGTIESGEGDPLDGGVVLYASRVDGVTGDAVFIAGH